MLIVAQVKSLATNVGTEVTLFQKVSLLVRSQWNSALGKSKYICPVLILAHCCNKWLPKIMVRIFIAYSSKDLVFKDEIRKRLRPLERAGKASIWDNWDIEGGAEWDAQIREKLEQSDLILLLLSPDALDSDYFYDVEAPFALRRHEAGKAIAVGILLRPCLDMLKHTPLGDFTKYELLPKKGVPITDAHWHHVDEAYLSVFREVNVLVERIGKINIDGNMNIGELEKTENIQKKADQEEADKKRRQDEVQIKKEAALKNAREAKARKKHEEEEATKKNQEAVRPKNGQLIRDIPEGPEMVFVEGGPFQMGSNEHDTEKPIHSVNVPSFWMGKYPVTFEEYDAFCTHTGKTKPKDEGWGRGLPPVINVSWEDAQAYCQWLSEKTGERYRLPSESEWEFAARGGTFSKGFKYAGSNDISQVAWYYENSKGKPQPVGEKNSNELGLHDMSGNVWEWCADTWHDSYKDAPKDGSAWVSGGEQDRAVLRGGSWDFLGNYCRASNRYRLNRTVRVYFVGLRVARAARGSNPVSL